MSALFSFFFFTHPSTTEIYTLSLHDALPIFSPSSNTSSKPTAAGCGRKASLKRAAGSTSLCQRHEPSSHLVSLHRQLRSEEHTSELQSHVNLVCRLLLEKKKKKKKNNQ